MENINGYIASGFVGFLMSLICVFFLNYSKFKKINEKIIQLHDSIDKNAREIRLYLNAYDSNLKDIQKNSNQLLSHSQELDKIHDYLKYITSVNMNVLGRIRELDQLASYNNSIIDYSSSIIKFLLDRLDIINNYHDKSQKLLNEHSEILTHVKDKIGEVDKKMKIICVNISTNGRRSAIIK